MPDGAASRRPCRCDVQDGRQDDEGELKQETVGEQSAPGAALVGRPGIGEIAEDRLAAFVGKADEMVDGGPGFLEALVDGVKDIQHTEDHERPYDETAHATLRPGSLLFVIFVVFSFR